MKRTVRILAVVFALFAVLAPARAADEEKDHAVHEELRALMKELIAAYNSGDVNQLLPFLDDEVIIIWQNAAVNRGPNEVKAYIDEMTKGPNKRVEKSTIAPEPDEVAKIYNNGNNAVAYGHSKDHYKLIDGTEFDQNTRWSATVVKKDGKWKLASVHISTNMFDNPILDIAVKRTMWWSGGIAGGIALVVGLLAGFMVGGRRKTA